METQSFEEIVKEYDKRRDMHYYVYFSSSTYRWRVDIIQFKKKSDVKNGYYRNMNFYSTYAKAQAVADRKNAAGTSVSHMVGHITSSFIQELRSLSKRIEGNELAASQREREAIRNLSDTASLITNLLNEKTK